MLLTANILQIGALKPLILETGMHKAMLGYQKDLARKKQLAQHLGTIRDKEHATAYLSVWLNAPDCLYTQKFNEWLAAEVE